MDPLQEEALACPHGCPVDGRRVFYVPKDRLTIIMCPHCKSCYLRTIDGITRLAYAELTQLIALRKKVRLARS